MHPACTRAVLASASTSTTSRMYLEVSTTTATLQVAPTGPCRRPGEDRRALLAGGGDRGDEVLGVRGQTTPSGGWR